MLDFHDDDDAAANLIERRWFAASAKVKALQDECEVMRVVMELAAKAYRGTCVQLAELEAMRDGLAQRLVHPDEFGMPVSTLAERRRERTAA